MPRLGHSICCSLSCSFLVLSLSAQQTQPTPSLIPRNTQERQRTWDAHHRITLIVQVTDTSGKPVKGLSEADFTVLDNQQTRPLISFAGVNGDAAPAAPHVILVLDEVNDSSGYLAYARKGIQELLRSQTQLPWLTSIAVLSQAGLEIGGSTRQTDALTHELALQAPDLSSESCRYDNTADVQSAASILPDSVSFDRTTQSPDCLNQHFVQSITQLQKFAAQQIEVPGRDLVIWLGPGWPLLNGPGFRPDAADRKQNFFDNLVQITNGLRESQVTLDVISPPGTKRRQGLLNAAFDGGVAHATDASAATLSLERLVRESGGLNIEEKAHISSAILRCMADADAWYTLSFTSPIVNDVQLHSISVKIDRPGLSTRTNTVYYAEP